MAATVAPPVVIRVGTVTVKPNGLRSPGRPAPATGLDHAIFDFHVLRHHMDHLVQQKESGFVELGDIWNLKV